MTEGHSSAETGGAVKNVLFVCNHNAGRSQMAQALFERQAPDDIRAESAGSSPAKAIWPHVIEAMTELDVELGGRPRKLTVEMQLNADWAVTMGCGDACPFVPAKIEDWDVRDPASEPIEVVREIRDEIADRITTLVGRIDEIREDHTAHQMRLARLLPNLIAEFEGRRSHGEIRACADAALAEYEDAPVRGFLISIAARRTRECLAADSCDLLPSGPVTND